MIVAPALRSVPCSGFMGLLVLTTMMYGCVGTRVEHFTDETYPARGQMEAIEWLAEAPTSPYLELARITVRSSNAGDETLRHSLLDRARRLGADAVIPETPVVVASAGPTPYYEPGILWPSGAAFGLYGYGWYSPYSSNPYILVQGAVDHPRRERYLSAIAIRYQDAAGPTRVP